MGEQSRPFVFGQVLLFLDAFGLLVAQLPACVGHRLRPRRLPAGKTGRFGSQVGQGRAPRQNGSGHAVVGEVGGGGAERAKRIPTFWIEQSMYGVRPIWRTSTDRARAVSPLISLTTSAAASRASLLSQGNCSDLRRERISASRPATLP